MLTISAVAENKKISLDGLEVQISIDSTQPKDVETKFFIEIDLRGELSQREEVLLFNSARRCDVSKLLSGKIGFQYKLIE